MVLENKINITSKPKIYCNNSNQYPVYLRPTNNV